MPVDHQQIAAALDAALDDLRAEGWTCGYWIPAVAVDPSVRDRADAEMKAAMRHECAAYRDAWGRPEMDEDLAAMPNARSGDGWQMTLDLLHAASGRRTVRCLDIADITAILDGPGNATAKRQQVLAHVGPVVALALGRKGSADG